MKMHENLADLYLIFTGQLKSQSHVSHLNFPETRLKALLSQFCKLVAVETATVNENVSFLYVFASSLQWHFYTENENFVGG